MRIRLDQLEPNNWNANEVKGDTYQLLVKDMAEAGQREPITVSPRAIFYGEPGEGYIICDGEHRYTAAKSLGWEELEATVEELTEDQAVTRFYRQQATRGGFDPLKEGQMFKYYLDGGLTQEQVVEKLGLTNRAYLTDRLALLKLSPLVQEIVAKLRGMLESRIRERATNETEEQLQELIDEIVERSTIDTIKLRYISTLPHNDQALIIGALLDTFVDGGTVSTRQVAQMVKEAKQRNEALVSFNAAWMAAATKNCPVCGRPPTLSGWDQAHRASNTFACAGGHSWRYDVTPEEARAQEQEGRRQRAEEAQRRAEEAVAARKTQDAKLIEDVLGDYAEPPTLDILMRELYQRSDIIDFGDVRKAVALYLQEHPDVRLTEPLTPQQLEAKKQQQEQDRHQYLEEKLARDEHHLKRIATLYRDELTRKQLLADYLELSHTVNPQDARDVIALYLEQHPEVTFPGDEPEKGGISGELFDREISAALGQPPTEAEELEKLEEKALKDHPKPGRTFYTIEVEEFEEADYARQEGGCRFGYSYDTGQGGGAGSIRNREGFLKTLRVMAREIWAVSKRMKSYPRPSMKSAVVTVCKAAAEEGLITEAEIWYVLLTYPATEERDPRPRGNLCDGCTEDCDECPHEDEENDEELEEPEAEEPEAPRSLEMDLTAAELHRRLVPWILGKVDELSDVTSIRVEGLRDKEEVLLEYSEPDKPQRRATFSYRVQTTTPLHGDARHIDTFGWLSFETKQLGGGSLEVISGHKATQEDLDIMARFLDDVVYTDLDPWDEHTIMGPTGFTMTPVDGKGEEPTIPVPETEEHHERVILYYEHDEEDLPVCPACGKQSPNAHYCTSCGKIFEKEAPEPEDVAHVLTPNEKLWDATATGKLGGLANALSLEEATWLRGQETRRRALKHLDKRIAVLRLANAPTLTLEEGP